MTTGVSSLSSPSTLVGLLWPSRDDARFAALRAIVLMVVGTAFPPRSRCRCLMFP
jgi:biotin transport system substrate-specific component